MPLPIAAIAGVVLRSVATRAVLRGGDVDPRDLVPAFNFSWSRKGRGIRRAGQRIKGNTERATRRAVVEVGKEVAGELAAIISRKTTAAIGIGKRSIRRQAPKPGDPRPVYTIRIVRAVPLRSIKGRKTFQAYPGAASTWTSTRARDHPHARWRGGAFRGR